MNVVEKPINDIKPYEKNPRRNDDAVQFVAESIKEFGFRVPILIDRNNIIIAGHTRHKAAKKLGLKSVPCIYVDDLTPDQVKAYRLADNKTAEKSVWDLDMLSMELFDIPIDMEPFGFDKVQSADEFGDAFQLDDGDKKPIQQLTFTLHDEQAALIKEAIQRVYDLGQVNETFGNDNHNGNGLYEVVRQWAALRK